MIKIFFTVLVMAAGCFRVWAQDPIAWWDFVDGEYDPYATVAMDASFNMHDGILYGGATWGTGYWDGAVVLDGRDDHVGVPSDAVFNLSQELTIYALIKWDGPDVGGLTHGKRVIFSRHDRVTLTDYGYLLYIDATDSKVTFTRYFSGGTEATIQSVTPITADMWTEVAVTHNISTQTVKLYIDGVEDAVSTPFGSGSISIHSDSIVIGADGMMPAAVTAVNRTNFNGLIDELEVYDQVIDPGSGDTTVTGGPDLQPYWPWGWDGEIVAATTADTVNRGTLTAGTPTYFTGAVINNGDTDLFATDSFYIQFYLEDDYLFYFKLYGLSAGYYNNNSGFPVAMPPGTYWITMVIDDLDNVMEVDEMNNEVSYQFTWAGSWQNLTSGQQVSGTVGANQSQNDYYVIDVSPTASALDIQVSGTSGDALDLYIKEDSLLTIYLYDTLAYTASGDEVISLDFSSSPPPMDGKMYIMVDGVDGGAYNLTATVTSGGTGGTANIRPYDGTWSAPLIVSHSNGAFTSDTELYADSTLYFSWSLENAGLEDITDTFYTAIYFDDSLVSSWYTAALSAGNTVTLSDYTGTLPTGSGMLKLVTDVLDNIAESDETDNTYQTQIQVNAASGTAPDLLPYRPTGWSGPVVVSHLPDDSLSQTTLYAGKSVYIDVLWANLGGTDITTPFTVALYDGTALLQRWTCNSISAGYWKREADWQTTLAAGEHVLSLKVDDQGAVTESSELNNTYAMTVYVSPFEPGQQQVFNTVTGGDDARSYRLVSVPFNPNPTGMDDILRATFGDKDVTAWRAFGYNGTLVEFPNIGTVHPGEAYWVLSRETASLKTTVASLVPVTSSFTGITIPANSWRLIASPFTFDVDWADVLDSTSGAGNLSALWEYNGSWAQSTAKILRAGKGYAVKNQSSSAVTLTIPPMVSNGVSGKSSAVGLSGIQLEARCGVYHDNNTFLGWAADASCAFDRHDQAEPPRIGSYVSVYTEHTDWDIPGRYTVDVRNASEDGFEWNVIVETDQDAPVVLSWSLPDVVTSGERTYLVDRLAGLFLDMGISRSYTLPAGKGVSTITILAGSEEFTQSRLIGLQSGNAPVMLRECSPSPFTRRTAVRYTVFRDTEPVRIAVCDQTGNVVRVLGTGLSGTMDDYRLTWDGTDERNRMVPAGRYYIELTSGNVQTVIPVVRTAD